MSYLVDGHNMLGQIPGLTLESPADRQRLVRTLDGFARARRCRITVVFDGDPPARWKEEMQFGRVRVLHSGRGRSADDSILAAIRRSRAPGDIMLVTSDRALYERGRHLGAKALLGHKFRERIASAAGNAERSAEKPDQVDRDEVDYFLRLFGESEASAPSRSRIRR